MSAVGSDDIDRRDMQRLVAGEDPALNALMDRHATRLFQYLIRISQDETAAEELAQESFVRVWENCGRFRTNQKFSTWLYAIATNLWRDRMRWRIRHPHLSLDATNPLSGATFKDSLPAAAESPAELLQRDERSELVRNAVNDLPEDLRTPLILSEYEELSQAEIASVLKCSPKAVEMRIYRARQHLRERLRRVLELPAL